jgi:F-type H+-transporting ATPase subunit alpha
MQDFEYFLEKTGEVGRVTQIFESIIYAEGLPGVHPGEVVLFEGDHVGYTLSLHAKNIEILLLSPTTIPVGTRLTRTTSQLKVKINTDYLGKSFASQNFEKELLAFAFTPEEQKNAPAPPSAPAASASSSDPAVKPASDPAAEETRAIDTSSILFSERRKLSDPFPTGIRIIDLLIPIAKGQRQLVIGDRKNGKSAFLLQALQNQTDENVVCIYASIGKPKSQLQRITNFFANSSITHRSIFLSSSSADRPGLIFLIPYVAMTFAEYFRDQGRDVVIVLDDLTTHARFYRETMLLARRFPGRNSYPGDIFYVHARLIERAGSSPKGTITCLPIAESVMGDLSGFIQTNLMAMTDGHIFFDSNLFDEGQRPSISPFLSVTRVGEQVQTQVTRELGRQLHSFLVSYEKIKQFKHFQRELNDNIQLQFNTGDKLTNYLSQSSLSNTALPLAASIATTILNGWWKDYPIEQMRNQIRMITDMYNKDPAVKKKIDDVVHNAKSLKELQTALEGFREMFFSVSTPPSAPTPVTSTAQVTPPTPSPQVDSSLPTRPIEPTPAKQVKPKKLK